MSKNEGSAEPEHGFKGLLVLSGVKVSSDESFEPSYQSQCSTGEYEPIDPSIP